MNENLISEQRNTLSEFQKQAAQEGQLDYGTPAVDLHLQELGLTRADLETEIDSPSDEQLHSLTIEEAEAFKTLSHIRNGRYSEACKGIESLLTQARAGTELFGKLSILRNQVATNPKNEHLYSYACGLVSEGWRELKQKFPKVAGMYVEPGQLHYGQPRKDLNIQPGPKTATFGGENQSQPGQLSYD